MGRKGKWKSKWRGRFPRLFTMISLSLSQFSPSLCLLSSCILIPPPEAVFSRQPIKTLLGWCFHVPHSGSAFSFSSPLSTPLLPWQTQIHSHKHILFVFYLLLHSSTFCSAALNICVTAIWNLVDSCPQFLSLFSFYSTSLISPYPVLCRFKHLKNFPLSFPKGDICFLIWLFPHLCHSFNSRAEQDNNLLLQLRNICNSSDQRF